MRTLVSLIVVAITGCLAAAGTTSAGPGPVVTVPAGSPIQIAVVLPHSGPVADAGANARNAVQMAVDDHGPVLGFAVQLNDFDGPCGGDVSAAHVAAATAVVANQQNLGVIGHYCSGGDAAALPIYEQAGVVAISGSTTETLSRASARPSSTAPSSRMHRTASRPTPGTRARRT